MSCVAERAVAAVLVSSKVNMIMMMARAAMRLVDRRQIAALVATVLVPHECGVSDLADSPKLGNRPVKAVKTQS